MQAQTPGHDNVIPPHAWRNIPSVLVQFCQFLQNKSTLLDAKVKEALNNIEGLDKKFKHQQQQIEQQNKSALAELKLWVESRIEKFKETSGSQIEESQLKIVKLS